MLDRWWLSCLCEEFIDACGEVEFQCGQSSSDHSDLAVSESQYLIGMAV